VSALDDLADELDSALGRLWPDLLPGQQAVVEQLHADARAEVIAAGLDLDAPEVRRVAALSCGQMVAVAVASGGTHEGGTATAALAWAAGPSARIPGAEER